jgi:hypothetical protein
MVVVDTDMPLVLKCQLFFTTVLYVPLNFLFLSCWWNSASTGVKRKGGSGGLNKVCGVSPQLQAIVGEPTMARTEVHSTGPAS